MQPTSLPVSSNDVEFFVDSFENGGLTSKTSLSGLMKEAFTTIFQNNNNSNNYYEINATNIKLWYKYV